jgi:hypothetical protein
MDNIENSMLKNIGSINDEGMLGGLKRKGFTYDQSVAEIFSNSKDAKSKNIDYNVNEDYIYIIDDGIGMDENTSRNMFDIHRSNHIGEKTNGVSGIGAKASLVVLSEETLVQIFTKKEGMDKGIRIEIPFDEMYLQKKYTGMINRYYMTEIEEKKHVDERKKMSNKYGTTIRFIYNIKLASTIERQFEIIERQKKEKKDKDNYEKIYDPSNKLYIIFGTFDIKVSYKFENNKSKELLKYDYFKGNDSNFYKGKNVETIFFYNNEFNNRIIWDSNEGQKEFKILKCSRVSTTLTDVVEDLKGYKLIGEFTITTGLRKDSKYFDEKNPKLPEVLSDFIIDYNKKYIPNTYKKCTYFENNCIIRRNGQCISSIDITEGLYKSTKKYKLEDKNTNLTQCVIDYNPISNIDNKQDIFMGIQENKNQYIPPPQIKSLLRLVYFIKKIKTKEIWEYFNKKINNEDENNEDENNEDENNEDEKIEDENNEDENNEDEKIEDENNEDEKIEVDDEKVEKKITIKQYNILIKYLENNTNTKNDPLINKLYNKFIK